MPDIDGLWTAEGATLDGWPISGVMVFFRDQVFGGGARHYCLGAYRLHGSSVEIEAHIYHYHGSTQSRLARGAPDFTVHYHGRLMAASEIIEGTVFRAETPSMRLPVQLARRAALPT